MKGECIKTVPDGLMLFLRLIQCHLNPRSDIGDTSFKRMLRRRGQLLQQILQIRQPWLSWWQQHQLNLVHHPHLRQLRVISSSQIQWRVQLLRKHRCHWFQVQLLMFHWFQRPVLLVLQQLGRRRLGPGQGRLEQPQLRMVQLHPIKNFVERGSHYYLHHQMKALYLRERRELRLP